MVGYEGVKQAHERSCRRSPSSRTGSRRSTRSPRRTSSRPRQGLPRGRPRPGAATLHQVLENIKKTYPKLEPGENLWLKMKPIHDQLFKGMVAAPSGTKWDDPAPQAVAEQIVKDFEHAEFWKDLGLATLARRPSSSRSSRRSAAPRSSWPRASDSASAPTRPTRSGTSTTRWRTRPATDGGRGDADRLSGAGQGRAAGCHPGHRLRVPQRRRAGARWAKASRAGLVPGMAVAGAEAAEISGLEAMSRRFAAGRSPGRRRVSSSSDRSRSSGWARPLAAPASSPRPPGLRRRAVRRRQADLRVREGAGGGPAGAAADLRPKGYKGAAARGPSRGDRRLARGPGPLWPDREGGQASYAKSIFEDPEREAGIWVDLDTGEHLVVQGSPDMVEAWAARARVDERPRVRGAKVALREALSPHHGQRLGDLPVSLPRGLGTSCCRTGEGRRPSSPRRPSRASSGGIRPDRKPSTRVRLRPGTEPPFWVEFKDAKTGVIRRERIPPTPRDPGLPPWLDGRPSPEHRGRLDGARRGRARASPGGAAA